MKKLEQRVPNLRFKGFTDDWEQRKLRDISTRVLRKNKDLQSTLPLTISAQDGLVDQTTFFHKQVASKQLSNYILLFKGEFAYNKSYSEGYPFGAIKRLNKYSKGVLSTLYIVFKPKNVNSDFLEHYYDTSKWYREIYRNAAEGARNHGLLNISAKDFFGTMLYMPQKNEQALIANVLDHLDSLITLQQRKLDLLKQLKKGFLQKMFAEKNSNQPVLRFKGFHDDWEQRKLIQVANYRNGRAHEKDINMNGNYIVVNSKFVSSNGRVKKFSSKLMEPLNKGEIAFVLSDVPNGKALARTFLVKEGHKYSLNQRIAGITPHQNISSYFLYILMNRNPYFLKFDDGVGQTNLSKKDVEQFSDHYPSGEEQQMIGKVFGELDRLIALQHQKLAKYQSVKKSLLQQMFI